MKSTLLLLLIMSFLTAIQENRAQPTFQRHYGGAYNDGAASIVATSDGCYVTAGYTQSFGHGGWDIYLVKTNALGDTLWTKTIGGTADDWATKIMETSDHNLVIVGSTHSFTHGGFDIFLVKTTLEGEVLWMKNYGGEQDDDGYKVVETSEGDFIVACTAMSYVNPGGGCCSYVLKVNSQGDSLWSKAFQKKAVNWGNSVLIDLDNNIVVSGFTAELDNIADVYVIKLNQSGDSLWTRTYDMGASEQPAWSSLASNGDYILGGYRKENNQFDILIQRISPDGDLVFWKKYGGSGDESGMGIYLPDQTIAIGGSTTSSGAGGKDVYLLRLSENGDSLWSKTYGDFSDNWATSIARTQDGGFIMSGYTVMNTNNADFLLIKTWNDGFAGIENPVPGPRWNVYPNPCHDQLNLETKISITGALEICVYNEQGQAVLQQTILSPAETINTSALKPGIYLLKMINSQYSESHRLVVLKQKE